MTGAISAALAERGPAPGTDWLALARELGPGFASRAAAYDANDSFPLQNYRELKERRVFSAGVPAELGGGHAEGPAPPRADLAEPPGKGERKT
jgi:alkylation response protein AidB-like acyl-CoA dehydrogenase